MNIVLAGLQLFQVVVGVDSACDLDHQDVMLLLSREPLNCSLTNEHHNTTAKIGQLDCPLQERVDVVGGSAVLHRAC